MTTTVFTACSDNDDKTSPVNPTKEPVNYTIIFYGQGGEDLDKGVMENISQFFLADASSYQKVNIVGQYKFSTPENLIELSMPEELAEIYGSKSLLLMPANPDFKKEGNWGSTFDATYKQLAFDKVVGWSRWSEVNKQMPNQSSPTNWSVDLFYNSVNTISQ